MLMVKGGDKTALEKIAMLQRVTSPTDQSWLSSHTPHVRYSLINPAGNDHVTTKLWKCSIIKQSYLTFLRLALGPLNLHIKLEICLASSVILRKQYSLGHVTLRLSRLRGEGATTKLMHQHIDSLLLLVQTVMFGEDFNRW